MPPSRTSPRLSLPAIITSARAGALDHAWAAFRAGGYDLQTADPAALAVMGRLLKDSARRAPPADRRAAYARAASAYATADAIAPQPYTRINVATLTLLGGDATSAAQMARDLLSWIDGQDRIAETPYFLAATRAEAFLLCGEAEAACAALTEAIACNPGGWEDHATTLDQLALILAETGGETAWLDRHRPPRSLHFAGHLGVAETDTKALRARIDSLLDERRIGFGFGALAAGSDIVIAEALIARGAGLHVLLPTAIDAFVAQSVAPFGAGWVDRFDACMAAADSVKTTSGVRGAYEPLATSLAADVAMGSAVLNAGRLASSAEQLLVIDEGAGRYGDGAGTARDGARWAASGRAQHVIVWPRSAQIVASGLKATEGRPDRRLAAMLHVSFEGLDQLDEGAFAEAVDTDIAAFRTRAATLDGQPLLVLPAGNARIMAFADPQSACAFANILLGWPATRSLRIGGHYALAHWLEEPAALVGRGVAELGLIANAAMPGVLTVSETFAAALFAGPDLDLRAEPVGEAGAIPLFAVSAQ